MATLEVYTTKKKRGRPPKAKGSRDVPPSSKMTVNKKVAQNFPLKSESHKRKRSFIDDMYDNDNVKSCVMERAEQIIAKLAPQFPIMKRCMLPSHVSGGFWLGLSKPFCDEHLPKEDAKIALEDESGESFETIYLQQKVGLSGGWRKFAVMHNLSAGDVLIFHLVMPTKFKVYIVRVRGPDAVDGALGLLDMGACAEQMNPTNATVDVEYPISKEMESQDLEHLLLNNAENIADLGPELDQSENENEELGFEIADGVRLSESVGIDFGEVKSFEDFDIVVNGLVINSELSKRLQKKYYELCLSQKSFLHDHLLDGLNCKLVAGILMETARIADAIRTPELPHLQYNFTTWKKTLESFQCLGMNVDFLLARLEQLGILSAKSKRYKEATLERARAEEEMRTFEAKVLNVKQTMNRLDAEIQTLGVNAENLELTFQEMAKAPWS